MASASFEKDINGFESALIHFEAALIGFDIIKIDDESYPEGLPKIALFDMFSVVYELDSEFRNVFKNDSKAKDESALVQRNVPEVRLIGNFARKQEQNGRPVLENFDHIVYLVEFAKKLVNSGKINEINSYLHPPLF